MATPYIGEIRIFAGSYAPNGWAFCEGQLLPIAEFDALFNLIGTTYGGDGSSTFALPDLRGRLPIHQGQGAGLTNRMIGERSGAETVSLTPAQLPAHNHALNATTDAATNRNPAGSQLAQPDRPAYAAGTTGQALAPVALDPFGANQPHPNLQPALAVNFIIALQGIYPTPG